MSDGFTVDTDVLAKDATQWDSWGSSFSESAGSISDSFEYWAFSNQPGFEDLRDQYLAAAADLRGKVSDGGELFQRMGARLQLIASIYEEAEEENRLDLRGA